MNLRSAIAVLAIFGMVATSFVGAEEATKEKKDPLKDIKCPMSGKAVNADKVVAYKDAKVFMCCGGCVKGLTGQIAKKDIKKGLVPKLNHQLVATKQAEQLKCPISGGKLNEKAKTKVVGLEVAFCCKNCQGKVAKMKEKEAVEFVFNEKTFEKAFKVKKEKEEKKAA